MRRVALVLAGVLWSAGSLGLAAPDAGGGKEGGPGAGGKRPDVSLPLEGVITDPDWIRTPNGDDFATYFPAVAQLVGLGGRIMMNCQVSTSGTLENCTITNETPKGLGFGDAALKISEYFRMKPMTVDGVPVAGAKINIPIRFEPSPDQAEAGAAVADGPQPSPKALELARHIAAITFGPELMQLYVDQARKYLGERFNGVSLTEQQQAVIDDYLAAVSATGPQRADAIARRYAREFTEQQLADIAAFLESPSGRAWSTQGTGDAAENVAENQRLQKATEADARDRFCGKYDCLKLGPPPPAPAAPAAAKK